MVSNVKEMLLGVETEYAVGGRNRDTLIQEIQRHVRDNVPNIQGLNPMDRFLSSGARFYLDCGGHPEWSTPECPNPTEVVRYALAGDKALADALSCTSDSIRKNETMSVFKCNVDYSGARTTWGSHESYLHVRHPSAFTEQIVPHLLSRIIFTGAGGFNPMSAGIEFTISPRVWHLQKQVCGSTTDVRGIFHRKDEPLARRGFHRLHIIAGESLCSHLASWLRVGTTGVVVAMIDAGLAVGREMLPMKPVEAMQAFARDPACRETVGLITGHEATALQIQRYYLKKAEKYIDAKWMPVWAEEVCKEWRSMLDRIEFAPESLSATLDWAIKLPVYEDYIQRKGFQLKELFTWNHVNETIKTAVRKAEHRGRISVELVLGRETKPSPIPDTIKALTRYLKLHSLDWDMLRPYVDLRQQLFEIDFRFAQLDGNGLFHKLDAAGVLDHKAPGVDHIEDAMTKPPSSGRARVRGRRIRSYADRPGLRCYWDGIWDIPGGRTLSMRDPLARTARWKKIALEQIPENSPIRTMFERSRGEDTVF